MLSLMVTGESNADIGEEPSVTKDINKFYVKHILNKIGRRRRCAGIIFSL
jgi:hypothetical protein